MALCTPLDKTSEIYEKTMQFVTNVVNKINEKSYSSSVTETILDCLQKLDLPQDYAKYMIASCHVPAKLGEMVAKYGWPMFEEPLLAVLNKNDITLLLKTCAKIAGYASVKVIPTVPITGPELGIFKKITELFFPAIENKIIAM